MRRIFTIAAVLLMTVSVWAQAPEKMSYQAVVRNSSNVLVSSTTVGMQISILQGSTSGTVVYTETHAPTTNANGLVSLEIGTGTTSDDFSTIDWANGPFFIQTETGPAYWHGAPLKEMDLHLGNCTVILFSLLCRMSSSTET